MDKLRMTVSKRIKAFGALAFIACFVTVIVCLRLAFAPRIIVRIVTPDNVELCLIQQGARDFPPFKTSFVFRKPGTNWGWFYYDHEDWYWRTAQITLDTNARVATIYRDGEPRVTFKWDTERFTLRRSDHFSASNGAQSRLPRDWEPGKRIE